MRGLPAARLSTGPLLWRRSGRRAFSAPAEVEPSVEGLVCEGFNVDWVEHCGRLYIRVWEFGGPEPAWGKVLAEQPLADIAELLREAGHDAEHHAHLLPDDRSTRPM